MKVLFAVSSESISDAIVKKYQKEYKEIISHKNVYYFNAILKEIQKDKTYDRIVISEDLEAFSNNNYDAIDKIIFEKLDNISDEAQDIDGNETSIILICTDRHQKGSSFLVKLFSIGIYNALLGGERSMEQVCKLINKPRTKKEAKMYYKIDSDDANYDNKNTEEVSEMEIQNILNHFKKISKNSEKFADSFNNIAAQYTDDQLKIIINCLPTNVKAVLEDDCKKYQELVTVNGMVQRVNREGAINQEARKQTGIKIDIIDNKLNAQKMTGPIVIPASVRTSKNKGPAPVRPIGNSIEVPITEKREPIKTKKVVKRSELNAMGISNPAELKKSMEKKANVANSASSITNKAVTTNKTTSTIENNVKSSVQDVKAKRARTSAELVQIPPVEGNIRKKENVVEEKKGRGRPKKIENKSNLLDEEDDFILPGMMDFDDEKIDAKNEILPGIDEEIEEDILPGMDEEVEEDILPGMDEEIEEDFLPGMDEEIEEDILPGMDEEIEEDILPGMDEEVEEDFLPGMDEEVEEDFLPGMDEEIEEDILPGMDDEAEEDILPGMDDEIEEEFSLETDEFEDDTLSGMMDDFEDGEDDVIPMVENEGIEEIEEYTEEVSLPDIDELDDFEDESLSIDENENIDEILPEMDESTELVEDDLLPGFDEEDILESDDEPSYVSSPSSQIESIKQRVDYSMSNLNSLLTKDKKIVTFIGTSKNGTSFLVNNLAALFSLSGINTAILDMTKNKNSYYIYTNNEEELRKIAYNSISKLQSGGYAEGIKVNKCLSVYTALPNDGKDYSDAEPILSTLVQNHSLILIDCDYDTDPSYFASCQEIYLVQSMDILTIQPLTAFLRDLKSKGVLESEKVRVVINKMLNVKSLTEKAIIGGMSFYNDPSMSFMTELFNKDMVKACTIPFDENVYSKYLDGIVNCKVSINGYEKSRKFWEKFKTLGDMVYPLVTKSTYGGKSSQVGQIDYGKNKFSNNMNNTLNQMKKKY
ncbi:MAG: hypothetical protein IKL55_04490 [Clostridia bacterium]|nr:hypothetical protein [Clostridia bacterium]